MTALRRTPHPTADRMSAKDRLLWRLETDTDIRSLIVLILVLDAKPDLDDLHEWHWWAARRLPRMAARVVRPAGPFGTPRWEPDPSFHPARHIRHLNMSGKGTRPELLHLAERLSLAPFIPGLPLWECFVVDGLEDGQCAYVLKISHAIADGLRLRDLFLQQSADQAVPTRGTGSPDESAPRPASAAPAATRPGAASRLRRAREAVRFASLVVRDMRNPPPGPVGTGDGTERRYFTLDLPMKDIRAAARDADGTVQDALVAGLTDGVRRYYDHWELTRSRMRVAAPYGRAPLVRDDPGPMGNHWFIVRFEVPTDASSTADRIRSARSAVRRVYHRDALDWMGGVAQVAPFLPARLLQAAFRRFIASHDFLISNIPGTPNALRIAGVTAEHLYGIAPSLGAALIATTVSYTDTFHVTLNVDPAVVKDVELLGNCLRRSLEQVALHG